MKYICYKCEGKGSYQCQLSPSVSFGGDADSNIKLTKYCETCDGIGEIELKPASTQVKVKYHNPHIGKLEKIEKGDWIDVRAATRMEINKGERAMIPLGFSIELPKGFEAHVVPRSSTYKHYKIIQTNSIGIIDESYCGDEDQWFLPVLAMQDTEIPEGERIAQFKIVEKMPEIDFIEVEKLGNENRNGFGSTGR